MFHPAYVGIINNDNPLNKFKMPESVPCTNCPSENILNNNDDNTKIILSESDSSDAIIFPNKLLPPAIKMPCVPPDHLSTWEVRDSTNAWVQEAIKRGAPKDSCFYQSAGQRNNSKFPVWWGGDKQFGGYYLWYVGHTTRQEPYALPGGGGSINVTVDWYFGIYGRKFGYGGSWSKPDASSEPWVTFQNNVYSLLKTILTGTDYQSTYNESILIKMSQQMIFYDENNKEYDNTQTSFQLAIKRANEYIEILTKIANKLKKNDQYPKKSSICQKELLSSFFDYADKTTRMPIQELNKIYARLDGNCQKPSIEFMGVYDPNKKKSLIPLDPKRENPVPFDIIVPHSDVVPDVATNDWIKDIANWLDLSEEQFLIVLIGAVPVSIATSFDPLMIIPYLSLGLGTIKVWDMLGTWIATSPKMQYAIEWFAGEIGATVGDIQTLYRKFENLVFYNGLGLVAMSTTYWTATRFPFLFEFVIPINFVIGATMLGYDFYEIFLPIIVKKIF